MAPEEREELRKKALAERFAYEATRKGGYELIFPAENEAQNAKYESFVAKANSLWDDFTTGGKARKTEEGSSLP
jgi:hypothetical protein